MHVLILHSTTKFINGHSDMVGGLVAVDLGDHHPYIMSSTTTEAQYQQALSRFAMNPEPDGVLLNWVCQDTVAALDLVNDRLEMKPT